MAKRYFGLRCEVREENVSGHKTVTIASALTRRRAMAGGTAALIVAPFVIRSGFAQSPAVNIGVIQPLSGANAQFGINCRNGIEFVADAINAAGASRRSAAPRSTWSSATQLRIRLRCRPSPNV